MKSAWKTWWQLVTWNLPLDTPLARLAATRFVRAVKKHGPIHGNRRDGAALVLDPAGKLAEELKALVPADGKVSLLPITDKQYEHSLVLWGKSRMSLVTA